ncbi:MAG TPA: hypothetical protein VH639_06260 [Bryobacteraceae bacterium]|jgi:hypothetical protein
MGKSCQGGSLKLICGVALFASCAAGQWLNYPAPGIPRLPDGKPNLSAPVPRTPDGKPDLSGLWTNDADPLGQRPVERKPGDIVLTPQGKALQRPRENYFPGARCLPNILYLAVAPFKIFVSRGTVVMLYEHDTTFRQIFIDGRQLPKDPNPTFMGYSVGKWDGDTLEVDTSGFNDDELILPGPHSDALHIIERFRRRDFGHLEIQATINDPKIYAKPWTITVNSHLVPDTELLEYICNENEKDLKHMVESK